MLVTEYEWIPPKTDWKISYDSEGTYQGDFFEPQDYNRIKNNVNYLRDYVKYMYAVNPEFLDLGEDVFYGSENDLTASWWKKLQDNLEYLNAASVNLSLGDRAIFYSNEAGSLLEELIRVETISLNMYTKLVEIHNNKPRLAFRLGNQKGIRC